MFTLTESARWFARSRSGGLFPNRFHAVLYVPPRNIALGVQKSVLINYCTLTIRPPRSMTVDPDCHTPYQHDPMSATSEILVAHGALAQGRELTLLLVEEPVGNMDVRRELEARISERLEPLAQSISNRGGPRSSTSARVGRYWEVSSGWPK